MHGLPPLLIQCGDAEFLRDEVTLLAHKCSLSGVAVRHELYEDCVHVFQASFSSTPAGKLFRAPGISFVQHSTKEASRVLRHRLSAARPPSTTRWQAAACRPRRVKLQSGNGEKKTAGDSATSGAGSSKPETSSSGKGKESASNLTPSNSSSALDGGINEIVSLPHQRSDGDVDDDEMTQKQAISPPMRKTGSWTEDLQAKTVELLRRGSKQSTRLRSTSCAESARCRRQGSDGRHQQRRQARCSARTATFVRVFVSRIFLPTDDDRRGASPWPGRYAAAVFVPGPDFEQVPRSRQALDAQNATHEQRQGAFKSAQIV